MMTNHVYFVGDLYDEQQLLSWLLTQKNPAGDVIEALEGQDLLDLIEESGSLAVYFCKLHASEPIIHFFTAHTVHHTTNFYSAKCSHSNKLFNI